MSVTRDDLSLRPSRPYTSTRDVIISCCCCCGLLLGFLVVMFFVVVLLFLLGRVIVVGKTLYADNPTIELDSITVSNFNLSNPISAHWNINMSMHNTYSSFEFSDSAISIFHKSKEEALWLTKLKGFDMRPTNTTVHFALDFGGSSPDVNDTTVSAIEDEITNNHGAVEFTVQFKADHPRSRDISPLDKFFYNLETEVNMLIFSCDVWLLFGSPDKTRLYMLMTNDQACKYLS